MAYLEPEELRCPGCGRAGELTWVVGEGPNTRSGEGPAYVDVLDPGPWAVETEKTAPVWAGRIACPDCGASVMERPGAPKE